MSHHIIGNHGELPVRSLQDYVFHQGWGPQVPCFDERKDVMIPTPNFHTPATPFAPSSTIGGLGHQSGAVTTRRRVDVIASAKKRAQLHCTLPICRERPLLLFFAGWNSGGARSQINDVFGKEPDCLVLRRGQLPLPAYVEAMRTSRFCAVCDGFAAWSPRLVEVMQHGCVPVIVSDRFLPPFAQWLDWSRFSLRISPSRLPHLRSILRSAQYEQLRDAVGLAASALEYRLDRYDGHGMLPLLVVEMMRVMQPRRRGALADGAARQQPIVRELYNDVEAWRSYEAGWNSTTAAPKYGISGRAGVQVDEQRWDCQTSDGYFCQCTHWKRPVIEQLLHVLAATGPRAWSTNTTARLSTWTGEGGIRKQLAWRARVFTRYIPPYDILIELVEQVVDDSEQLATEIKHELRRSKALRDLRMQVIQHRRSAAA